MRGYFTILTFLVGCASAFAVTFDQLLSEADMEFQRLDNADGIAIGSAVNSERPWVSYNEWQCFPVSKIELSCAEYDHGTLVPSIKVATGSEVLLFDSHVEDRLDCQKTLSIWQTLFTVGEEACIFAAHMPEVNLGAVEEGPQSLWYISRLKGAGGYWDLPEKGSEVAEQ